LRDYQQKIVDVYISHVSQPNDTNCGGGITEVYCGGGKTILALKIVELLQKKTLILVHKEFLMNQWIERIEEFLPGARVGKIQASVCDCEDKDIVIGMIQTMYNKVFPQEVYSQFGLTIIDEVHRIGSEEFSKTLLKTITPCMLGISATVERKDKLTKLLYMFIGPKVYSLLREQDDIVNVRGIEYITPDTEFNTVEYDYRGNTKFSTMISKLSNFGPRSDFVVRVIHDLLDENTEGQVMVLCHYRCLLTYLYDSIMAKGLRTVGFYVGGMKQAALEETESKQIVLATYAMAAEALDIKTLSMLVMASPKTDITQSVGRILRIKHDNPVVVDIVDSHDIFQRQWLQRKRFYKKSNYAIRYIKSPTYTGMKLDWENDTSWKMVYDPNNKSVSGKTNGGDNEGKVVGKCMINIAGL
jgi:superfamily II DNA or RNA helicase